MSHCPHRWSAIGSAVAVAGWLGTTSLVAGCAAQPVSDVRAARLSDNFSVYDMYDNQRDWGPSFLVGPPSHHLGDESRIDDTRLVPRLDSSEATAADPASPPTTPSTKSPLMQKPLPPLP